jgi:hypothetical protein
MLTSDLFRHWQQDSLPHTTQVAGWQAMSSDPPQKSQT